MNNEAYPCGDIAHLVSTFLKNRAIDLGHELEIPSPQWERGWDSAYQLRGFITNFWIQDAGESKEGERSEKAAHQLLIQFLRVLPKGTSPVTDFFRSALDHVFAEQICDSILPQLPLRLEWLASQVVQWKVGGKALQYLRSVAITYLYGLDHVCAIMCRAALEGWLEANISNDQCHGKRRPKTKAGDFGLADRIEVAHMLGIFSHDMKKSADEVRVMGDRAVHRGASYSRRDIEQCIIKLIQVLNAITPEAAK